MACRYNCGAFRQVCIPSPQPSFGDPFRERKLSSVQNNIAKRHFFSYSSLRNPYPKANRCKFWDKKFALFRI